MRTNSASCQSCGTAKLGQSFSESKGLGQTKELSGTRASDHMQLALFARGHMAVPRFALSLLAHRFVGDGPNPNLKGLNYPLHCK